MSEVFLLEAVGGRTPAVSFRGRKRVEWRKMERNVRYMTKAKAVVWKMQAAEDEVGYIDVYMGDMGK